MIDLHIWERRCREHITGQGGGDLAHDLRHVERVVASAKRLAAEEGAELAVLLPAAWLHDCVHVAKDDPRRTQASRLAAQAAVAWLRACGYPERHLPAIAHAIAAHSFSAGIPCQSVEARVLQDADRLDALGAIGLTRMLLCGAGMQRELYDPVDPFCRTREPDDGVYSIDHCYTKLLRLEATMQTEAGRREAQRRSAFLRAYLAQLETELS